MATATQHKVVSHEEWIAARTAFLAKEKEFTKQRDEVSRQRRELPWEKVEKNYVFEGPNGRQTLSDLFGKNSQLIVYHFMFAPDWDEGCEGCSFWADNFNLIPTHLNARDTAFVSVSRAPVAKLEAFKRRMGWSFPWFSSDDGDFNYDFGASFRPEEVEAESAFFNYRQQNPYLADREGASVFFKDENGDIYHTYSTFARGIDLMNTAYNYLDLTPKGRDEPDNGNPNNWLKLRDEY